MAHLLWKWTLYGCVRVCVCCVCLGLLKGADSTPLLLGYVHTYTNLMVTPTVLVCDRLSKVLL